MDSLTIIYSNPPKFYGISYDTIFTTSITIIIFICGFLINKIYEYRKEVKRLSEIKEYFFQLCEFLKDPVVIQKDVFNQYSKDIESEQFSRFVYKDTVDLDLNAFNDVSKQDLYKILYRKKGGSIKEKARNYNNILNSVNFIQTQKFNTLKNYEMFYSEYKKYEPIWEENGGKILTYYNTYVSLIKNNQTDSSQDQFVKEFVLIVAKWAQLENSKNIFVSFTNLITPLREMCNKYSGDQRVSILLDTTSNCIDAFNNIVRIKKRYSELFLNEAKELDEKYQRLIQSLNYFK